MELNFLQILERLKTTDETARFEVKEAKQALGTNILETISAFANEPELGGGYIIFGLRQSKKEFPDRRYTIVGVEDPDKIQCELATLSRTAFNVPVRPEIKVEIINEKALIIAFIAESFCREKPVYIKKYGEDKGAFRRIASSDQRCTSEDLDLLYQLRRQRSFETEVLPDASWNDIQLNAIEDYRKMRRQIDPSASELKLDDQELLISLGLAVRDGKDIFPTIGGLLLFGTKMALRRTMPMASRIDYIIVEGIEWVNNPLTRYHSVEYRDPLVSVIPHIYTQILNDLPSRFHLEPGSLQRNDIPAIPRDVIREALANALMHKDYRVEQPVQIIRYANRIEFHNPGYSLKPFEELGLSGSLTRNTKIAGVFHDLKFAETKGTGIRTMKKLMNEAGLTTPPLFETNRERNRFNLLLLPQHLLDEDNLKWISQFRAFKLSDADINALIFARMVGAITNLDYRQISGTHPLAASKALGRLRDRGLLTMKGSGAETYYQLVTQSPELEPIDPNTSTSLANKRLDALPAGFENLSENIKQKIANSKERLAKKEIEEIILELCSLECLQLIQLGKILDKDPQYLRIFFLSKMIKMGKLAYLFPDNPTHPQQAYKTIGPKKI